MFQEATTEPSGGYKIKTFKKGSNAYKVYTSFIFVRSQKLWKIS